MLWIFLLRLLHIPSLWRQIGVYYRTFSFATIPQSNQSQAPSYHICSQLKSRCYYLESNRPVAFHQSGLSCCQSFPYIFLFRLKLNQLLWRFSYLSSCLAKRLQAFWISGRPTNPSHFLASYRLHQARVGLPYEALVTFIICFFYWFFQLRLPNLHSRYKAENSTLIYLGRSIHWQKEEANRNLLSIHLKITLLLLLLTPFDFLLLCLCLLRYCSLCATCDYTWTYSKWCETPPLIILQYPAKDQ